MNTAPASECSATPADASLPLSYGMQGALPNRIERTLADLDSRYGFLLFILVNAALFLRPGDMIAALSGWPIYETLIGLSLIISSRRVLQQLTLTSLRDHPITACILGLWITVVLSNVFHFRIPQAAHGGIDFAKLVVYYLLLVGIVNTPSRLFTFLKCMAIFSLMHMALAVLHYYGRIHIQEMVPIEEKTLADASGEVITKYRICGAGIFHDTNDMAVLVSVTMLLCVYHVSSQGKQRGWRLWSTLLFWVGGMILCAHTMMLTQSRGGLLAMLAGLGVFLLMRFGWKSLVLVAVLPFLRQFFSGRQVDYRMLTRTTAQMRMGYWQEGLSLFAHSPLYGIGQGQFASKIGNVAHNSFVHCFTELGFFGGMFFLAAFFLAFWPIFRLRLATDDRTPEQSELHRLRPYFLAMVVAWTIGMFSLSRAYVTPTYIIVGLGTIYLGLLTHGTTLPRPKFNGRLLMLLAGLSVASLGAVYSFVLLFRRG